MLFWYMVGIVISASLLALGIILIWGWLITISLIAMLAIAAWGFISSGPGSRFNPYHQH